MKKQAPPSETRLLPPLLRMYAQSAAALAVLNLSVGLTVTMHAAPAPPHGILGANIGVAQLGFDNDPSNVIVSNAYAIGDFRIRDTANRGDYDVQMGDDPGDDVDTGLLVTSVRENGRDNVDQFGTPHVLYPGTNFATSHIDYSRTLGAYFIPVAMTYPNAIAISVIEYNLNVAAGWFPYANWVGGFAHYASTSGSGPFDTFKGSPGLALGTHFVDLGSGRARVDLTSLGIDSRADGVLLVVGAKNEDNYALSQVNANDGTWNLFSKDNGTDGSSTEQDPLAFLFVPKTNTLVVSGRFQGDGTILLHSGATPPFTVTNIGTGEWELKITGHSPRFGVLLVSPEGGFPGNQDNIVTYQVNNALDGWIIQSRDLPAPTSGPFIPPLETPGGGTEPVASFVFIPGPTPGFVVTPTSGLFTSENGDTTTFTVVLEAPPIADVTIAVNSSNVAEGTASPPSLTFTVSDWNIPQTVTITGQDDALMDGALAYNIILAAATSTDPGYHGLNPPDVAVINADNDSGGITVLPTSGLTTAEAGTNAAFTVRLNVQPTADVTIGLSSSDTTEGTVSPGSLTFTSGNWDQPQAVTVTGVDDFVDDGDISYTIITAPAASADLTFNGQNASDVLATNLDDDMAGIVVNPTGLSVIEGGNTDLTISLGSQPTANVTVNVASSDTAQGGTVTPPARTFTPANWNVPQSITITGANDLVLDGDTVWAVTNTASSTDPLYAALAPLQVPVTTLDNEPELTLLSGTAIYGIGMPGTGIDGRATVSDAQAPDYAGGTLTVTLTANATADDRLEVRNTGTGPGQIEVSGSNVSHEGLTIGNLTGGVGASPLVVTFNSAATPAAAQALLRNVTFRNVSSEPSLSLRTVAVTLAHADGGAHSLSKNIRVGVLRAIEFQEGVDHGYGAYSGAADIELFESQPAIAYPAGHSATGMWMDARRTNDAGGVFFEEAQVLMRFDNIVGDGSGQIPTNAIIVSAELLLNVRDSGDGSPLFRMLIPWNADTETWDSIGNGIQIDGIEARTTWDSQLGVAAVTGGSETGRIGVGVTTDVQAWVNGETNYGWGMTSWDYELNPSWSRGTDGLAFSPSEAPNFDDRPRLRVLWVPGGTHLASFRQDVNGYTGAQDTRIRQAEPDLPGGTLASAFVDAIAFSTTNNPDILLFRFDNIFGTNPGEIPPGARIDAAMLDLATVIGNGFGDGGQLFAMLSPWQDTDTWNSLVDGITTDGVEAASNPTVVAGSAALAPNVCGGYMSFDVTPDVQDWANGTRPNHGWAILPWPNGGDGWGLSTSESGTERDRPRLRVFYTPGAAPQNIVLQPPTVTPTTVQIRFTGTIGNTYTIRRSGAVDGTYTSIGTAMVQPDGSATFTDNAPLTGAAFYRVSYP